MPLKFSHWNFSVIVLADQPLPKFIFWLRLPHHYQSPLAITARHRHHCLDTTTGWSSASAPAPPMKPHHCCMPLPRTLVLARHMGELVHPGRIQFFLLINLCHKFLVTINYLTEKADFVALFWPTPVVSAPSWCRKWSQANKVIYKPKLSFLGIRHLYRRGIATKYPQ